MTTDILWIKDHDAEFLIGADGWAFECKDDQGNEITLFNVNDSQVFSQSPGSITRLLVVSDIAGKLWATPWYAMNSGTPGFLWDAALTKNRLSSEHRQWRPYQWVGFRPVEEITVKHFEYRFLEETQS